MSDIDLKLGDSQLILKTCRKHGLSLKQAAYVMATALWETNHTMKPVREAYWLSDSWRKDNLRYYPWYGRGYVQLTWERNYKFAGEQLGLDLTTDADVAMQSEVAVEVLVVGMLHGWFTGLGLSDFTDQYGDVKYISARKIVNGTDKDAEIAVLAKNYETALTGVYDSMGYGGAVGGIAAALAALGGAVAVFWDKLVGMF